MRLSIVLLLLFCIIYTNNIDNIFIYYAKIINIFNYKNCLLHEYYDSSNNICLQCPDNKICLNDQCKISDCVDIPYILGLPPWFKKTGAYLSKNKEYIITYNEKFPNIIFCGHRAAINTIPIDKIKYYDNIINISNILTCDGIISSSNGIYKFNNNKNKILFSLFGNNKPIELFYIENYSITTPEVTNEIAIC